jgi:hypothetical protein
MSTNMLYWFLSSASVKLVKESPTPIHLVYMGAPYGMETPASYSFVCTRTVFQLVPENTKGPSSRVQLYIEHFQVTYFFINIPTTSFLYST